MGQTVLPVQAVFDTTTDAFVGLYLAGDSSPVDVGAPTAAALAKGAVGNIAVSSLGTAYRPDGRHHLTVKSKELLSKKFQLRGTQARVGLLRCNILVVGDSTSAGVPARANSYPTYLAQVLTSMGRPATASSWFGLGGQTTMAAWQTYDPRISYGAGWTVQSNKTVGGQFPCNNGVDLTALSFTPTDAFDTIEIIYYRQTGNATFTVDIGGAVLTGGTINSAGATALQRATVSTGAAAALGTVNIKRNGTGTNLLIMAVMCYDSAKPMFNVWNGGWFGSVVADWSDSSVALSPINAINFLAPNLTIINLGINDWIAGTNLDTYLTNLQAVINAAAAQGDVILCSGFASSTALATEAIQLTFVDAIRNLAWTNNIPYMSYRDQFGTWADASAAGWTADARHPNSPGHARAACVLADFLTAAV